MSSSAPGPTKPTAQWVLGPLPGGLIGQGIILITQLYLMPILRMNGSIPLHPPYVFMQWTGRTLPLPL